MCFTLQCGSLAVASPEPCLDAPSFQDHQEVVRERIRNEVFEYFELLDDKCKGRLASGFTKRFLSLNVPPEHQDRALNTVLETITYVGVSHGDYATMMRRVTSEEIEGVQFTELPQYLERHTELARRYVEFNLDSIEASLRFPPEQKEKAREQMRTVLQTVRQLIYEDLKAWSDGDVRFSEEHIQKAVARIDSYETNVVPRIGTPNGGLMLRPLTDKELREVTESVIEIWVEEFHKNIDSWRKVLDEWPANAKPPQSWNEYADRVVVKAAVRSTLSRAVGAGLRLKTWPGEGPDEFLQTGKELRALQKEIYFYLRGVVTEAFEKKRLAVAKERENRQPEDPTLEPPEATGTTSTDPTNAGSQLDPTNAPIVDDPSRTGRYVFIVLFVVAAVLVARTVWARRRRLG